ncbi:MAG: acyl-CoA dehydrogenase family protein [Candidatus Lambdaproteobacteria bacterium]|nr:acyl-CoA dehydrogenase family protein [Candidatus Lambdaproteobacteria bacterium]
MDFGLSAEQEAIRDTARQFAKTRLLPNYQVLDEAGALDRAVIREMGGLGLIAATVPEALGGAGLDYLTQGLITEEVAYGDHSVSYVPLLSTLGADIIMGNGTPELQREWLPRLCSGELLAGLGLTEPGHGSDAAHIVLRARRDGDQYVLNGEKTSISLSDQADVIILFARTDPADAGAHGVSAFVVPMELPGISRTHFDDVGTRGVGRGSIFFEDARIPARYRLGEEGRGFTQVMQGFDFSRAVIGLQCLGTAQASVDETWSYVVERKAFGAPIVKFEGVSFPLAEAETHLEAARQLCYKTLWLRDRGRRHTAEAAMCKWWAPKLAFDVIHNCLLLHGHAGYSDDYPHQQRLRDVLGLQIGDGTAQIMKLIIARERVGRIAVPY